METTYTEIKKEYAKLEKQIEALNKKLDTYDRTKLDGPWTSKDGKNARVCIDNIRTQMGILSMIIL